MLDKHVRNLLDHVDPLEISSWDHVHLDELKAFSYDHKTYAEHVMIRSSAIPTRNPWVPYALLSGAMNVNQVNYKRQRENDRISDCFVFVKKDSFNIPPGLGLVNIRFSMADPKTLEVAYPTVSKVGSLDGKERVVKDVVYTGEFLKQKRTA